MASVFAKDSLKMPVVEWDEKVEALADGPDQPFAIRIGFGSSHRRFQDPDESVRMIERQKLAELLNRRQWDGRSRSYGVCGANRLPWRRRHTGRGTMQLQTRRNRRATIVCAWLRTKVVQR